MSKRNNLSPLADEFGRLKAKAAEIEQRLGELKVEIVASGHDAIEGDLFRVTVSQAERQTLDMAAVREKLSPQFIAKHTNVTVVTSVRCVARIGEKAA